MINIVNIVDDLSNNNPGIASSILQCSRYMQKQYKECRVSILAWNKDKTDIINEADVNYLPALKPGRGRANLRKHISNIKEYLINSEIDLVHIHGTWLVPQLASAIAADEQSIPFIITHHGMMEPWAIQEQGRLKEWKKKIYWKYIAYTKYRKAKIVHAITKREAKHLRKWYPDTPIQVIPNAVDLRFIDQIHDNIKSDVKKEIIFLGRIHPIKGVDLLIKAFIRTNLGDDWVLKIIGPVYNEHYQGKLITMINSSFKAEKIKLLGPVFGPEKYRILSQAWVTVVPSYSEVMGFINLESAACNTPTITTNETGLNEWDKHGNILIQPNVDDLSTALKKISNCSERERLNRGILARQHIEENYSAEIITDSWVAMYKGCLEIK